MDTRKPIDTRKPSKAETYHKSFSSPEQETYQKEFNYGQAQINFLLNEVDKGFVAALKDIVAMLKKIKELPSLKQELTAIDFINIDKVLAEAEERSKIVAGIRPPGCETYPS